MGVDNNRLSGLVFKSVFGDLRSQRSVSATKLRDQNECVGKRLAGRLLYVWKRKCRKEEEKKRWRGYKGQ